VSEGLTSIVARSLIESGALLFGEFRLASGAISHVYVDLRRVLGSPRHFRTLSTLLTSEVIRAGIDDNTVVVGVATGGIAWATAISLSLGLPLAYVRPPKGHGTEKVVEGAEVSRRRAIVIDDVATTGGSLASSVNSLLSLGASQVTAVVLVDREQGASEALAKLGVQLRRVTTLREVLVEAVRLGAVSESKANRISEELWGRPLR